MCGIVGVVSHSPVNQLIYDALLLLQHRGQDAAGIATHHGNAFAMHKANGLVRDVFRTRNMRTLLGTSGIGHVLAHEIQQATVGLTPDPVGLFKAVSVLHQRVKGAYAAVAQIAGMGLLAFRDPLGIRPLCLGVNETEHNIEYMVASESVALEGNGFRFLRDVQPGEAVFISNDGKLYSQQCAENPSLNPCAFEYVYFARPDSILDGASVYATRLKMGEFLAEKVRNELRAGDIDVVMPIPDSSRPSAMQLAQELNLDYREGLIKNRYIGRTFLMPGQAIRKKSVRQKLNTISAEFKGKSVLLVDDSVVRGTTSREIVQMAREAGARRVIIASAAPPVRFPNVYGIDMPTRSELIAHNRSTEEIAAEITADALVYQDIDALKRSISSANPAITRFDTSCFDGVYVTGDVTREYLDKLEVARNNPRPQIEDAARSQLNLNRNGNE